MSVNKVNHVARYMVLGPMIRFNDCHFVENFIQVGSEIVVALSEAMGSDCLSSILSVDDETECTLTSVQ